MIRKKKMGKRLVAESQVILHALVHGAIFRTFAEFEENLQSIMSGKGTAQPASVQVEVPASVEVPPDSPKRGTRFSVSPVNPANGRPGNLSLNRQEEGRLIITIGRT